VANHQNRTEAAHTNAGAAESDPSSLSAERMTRPPPTIPMAGPVSERADELPESAVRYCAIDPAVALGHLGVIVLGAQHHLGYSVILFTSTWEMK
jgi:hypothetical protein